MSCKLDISAAQMTAINDYMTRHSTRFSTDFLRKDITGCILCGDVQGGAAAVLRHVHLQMHKKNVGEYNNTIQVLLNTEQRCTLRSDCSVSRREVIVCYLAKRVQQADGMHNREPFDTAVTHFIQHRLSLGGLRHAFQSVHGTERDERECKCIVCLERPSTMMFTECRHVCTCVTCAVRLKGNAEDDQVVQCPVCRRRGNVVAVYIS